MPTHTAERLLGERFCRASDPGAAFN